MSKYPPAPSFLQPCCGERKGREDESASESSANNLYLRLDNLRDDLLTEILVRLPTAKSAIGFKLVSKRWCSLISSRYFVSQFITHHINDYDCYAGFPNPPSVFMINRYRELFSMTGKKEDLIFNKSPLELLPENSEFVSIMASCNDLLLCRVATEVDYVVHFYICNPFTKHRLLLPSGPVREFVSSFFGLVCEPNYQRWVQGQQCDFRFRVVCVNQMKGNPFVVDIYCSETGQWRECLLLGAEYENHSSVVANDGKLYWYNGTDVVAYDPFNNDQTIFIDGSELKLPKTGILCHFTSLRLGVCQGFLRLMRLVSSADGATPDHLGVWEIKDCETKRLSLVCKISFNNMISENSLARKFGRNGWLRVMALAFHPNNKEVVYLRLMNSIITCNLQTREVEVVGEVSCRGGISNFNNIFTIVLPWWPTPVSMAQMPISSV